MLTADPTGASRVAPAAARLRVVLWGTYDIGKPRNRILIQGLRENGFDVIECHAPIWQGIEDKSQVRSRRRRLFHGLRWLACYPRLLLRYLRLPAHDLVLVGYLGQLDVLLIRPLTIERVFVGAEPLAFYPPDAKRPQRSAQRPYRVLFYGQFIPLHGMEVIAEAARLCEGQGILWEVIGDGQEGERFRGMLQAHALTSLTWIPWVPYADLIEHIHAADLCLGIFGTSAKAGRVIPNKVFQVLAAGRALITAQSPRAAAIR